MMKKILIVVADSMPGGITSSAKNLIHLLHENGHSVTLLNMASDDNGFKDVDNETHRIYLCGMAQYWQLGSQNIKNCKNPMRKFGLALLGVVKKLTIRCGLWYRLIFFKMDKLSGFDAVLAFRQCEPCYYMALHKTVSNKTIGFIHGEKKYMGDISSWDKYFEDFDYIACVSYYVRNEFSQAYPDCADKFKCIYNSFDIDGIRRKAEELSNVDFSTDLTHLVTVARIENVFKQIDLIPLICRQLIDKGLDAFHWYVVGDGPDLQKDMTLAQELGVADYITFTGMQSNPFPILKNADLYVGTSKSEAYSMTIREAHILGIPVLSFNYATAHEAIEDGVDGYIVDSDSKALADKIEWLLADNRKELAKLQKSTRERQVTNALPYSQLINIINK